jgi:flagellum-specific peptidoglycan hydrolase FlgJ
MAIIVLACSITLPASAATTYKVKGTTRVYYGTRSKVYYDGQKISSSKKYGIYVNDNFMIPYKRMLVTNGPKMTSSYNKSTKTLILNYKNTQLRMVINSKKVFVNGVRKSNLNTPPMIVKMEGSSVILVPAKRVCAEFGLGYSYNSSTRQLYITGPEEKPAETAPAPATNTMVNAVNSAIKASSLKNLTTAAFIGLLGPMAQADYRKSGVLASVTLAHAINESGWGKTELAQKGNNIFGMKISLSGNTWSGSVWDGKSKVTILTTEEYGGRKVKIKAAFRKYPSISESIADHSAYLVNAMNGSKRRYYGLTATKKYKEQLKILQKGGYCTWGSYVSELTNLIKKYKLTKFDN